MDVDALTALHRRIVGNAKDARVVQAIEHCLESASELDGRINVMGTAHVEHWLSNRKRALWRIFDQNDEQWIQRCIERIVSLDDAVLAAGALLGSNVLKTLTRIVPHSPNLHVVWNAPGCETCGLGFGRNSGRQINDYFYVGWQPEGKHNGIVRVEYTGMVEIGDALNGRMLHEIDKEWTLTDSLWCEMPYGHGEHQRISHSFHLAECYRGMTGSVAEVIAALGYRSSRERA